MNYRTRILHLAIFNHQVTKFSGKIHRIANVLVRYEQKQSCRVKLGVNADELICGSVSSSWCDWPDPNNIGNYF